MVSKTLALLKSIEEKKNDPNKGKNEPGRGKKLCNSCKTYIGVATKICKCGFNFEKQIDLNLDPVFVYECLRLDKWEQYQAQRIIKGEQDYYWAPVHIRPLCYSLEDLEKRWECDYPKDPTKRLVIKCELTNEYQIDPNKNKRVGQLRKLKVVEICQ